MALLKPKKKFWVTAVVAIFVTTVPAFVVSSTLTAWLVNRLVAQRGLEHPDFGTNALNWYAVGAGVVNLFAAPLYLLVVYCAVLPLMHRSAKWSRTTLLNPHLVTAGVLLPGLLVLIVCMTSSSPDDHIFGPVLVGPLMLLTTLATYRLVKVLNADLRRCRSGDSVAGATG